MTYSIIFSFSSINIFNIIKFRSFHIINIVNLTTTPRFEYKLKCSCFPSTDINKTVDELAELFGIDVLQKRVALLNKWLADSTETDFNMTVAFIPDPNLDAGDAAADDMKRAAYLCSGGGAESWRAYLLKIGCCDSGPDCKNYAYRARALVCFCMITEPERILELTDNSKEELM